MKNDIPCATGGICGEQYISACEGRAANPYAVVAAAWVVEPMADRIDRIEMMLGSYEFATV